MDVVDLYMAPKNIVLVCHRKGNYTERASAAVDGAFNGEERQLLWGPPILA